MEETKSNTKHLYENIAFEGGAVRGYALIGALKALEDMNILKDIRRFSGTSIGAFFAALACIGFNGRELEELRHCLDFSDMTGSCWFTTIFRLIKNYGVYDSNIIERQFRFIIKKKVDPEITLEKLYELTGNELVIISCNLNKKLPVYFHRTTYPDTKLIDAIMASIFVPFLFKAKKFNFDGVPAYYIDGGASEVYPIWCFNDLEKLENGSFEDMDQLTVSDKTIGLKLLGTNERNTKQLYYGFDSINSVMDFGKSIITSLMIQIERADISPKYIKQTIPIQTGDIYFLNFNITEKEIQTLINNGYTAVFKYMKDNNRTV